MSTSLVEQIAAKAATLPPESQREVLAVIERLAARAPEAGSTTTPASREEGGREAGRSFASVKGILKGEYDSLEQDIAEIRSEMWKNFGRDIEP